VQFGPSQDGQPLTFLLAQGTQDVDAAHRETNDGSKGSNQHDIRAEMKKVGHNRAYGEDKAQYVQPQGRVDSLVEILTKAELQKKRGQADRRNYQESEWTQECASRGVEDDESESKKKQASGHQCPTTGLGRRN